MTSAGIRDLKNNLSRYIRRVAAGERIAVTDHGRTVAELRPPTVPPAGSVRGSRYEELLAAGIVRLPLEEGDPLADWPAIRLPKGTVEALINEDRADR
jgi:prevent-host-death family protein